MDYKLAKDKQGWILDNFRQLGLEVYTQEFTVDRPLLGTQVQGVLFTQVQGVLFTQVQGVLFTKVQGVLFTQV